MIVIHSNRQYAANSVRKYRKAAGFTLEELGQKLEPPVTLATIQKLEKSQMGLTLDYMIQISKVLKVPLLALADDDYENRLSEEVAAAPAVSKCIAAGKLEIPLRSDTSVCVTGLPLDLTDDEANRLANVIVAFANGGISSREKNG